MLVKDIMSRNLITVKESDPLKKAALLMRQYDVGILPVVRDSSVVGVITDRDIVTRGVACIDSAGFVSVGDCMSKSTVYATPTQEVSDVMKTMSAQQVRRVPVVENGSLCGILTLGDISRNKCDAEVASALCEISRP